MLTLNELTGTSDWHDSTSGAYEGAFKVSHVKMDNNNNNNKKNLLRMDLHDGSQILFF